MMRAIIAELLLYFIQGGTPMEKMRLGRTDLSVGKTGFGALPIQRTSRDEARRILRKAFDNDINFFDTARNYTDSEEKIGDALADVRKEIFIASKTMAKNGKALVENLETSLKNLKTDYIDLYQLHNPDGVPGPDNAEDVYDALLEAKRAGKIRFIGITNHRADMIRKAIESGLYDTVQFPFSHLSSEDDINIVKECKKHDIGFIAMKALSGGLITNASAAFAFMRQFDNVLPIWGVQRESELDEFLALEATPQPLDDQMRAVIEKDKIELGGNFCRGCGYCLPCPVGIPINFAARMALSLKRMPNTAGYLGGEWHEKMKLIEKCTACGQCKSKCPYNLDTPELLRKNLAGYLKIYEER